MAAFISVRRNVRSALEMDSLEQVVQEIVSWPLAFSRQSCNSGDQFGVEFGLGILLHISGQRALEITWWRTRAQNAVLSGAAYCHISKPHFIRWCLTSVSHEPKLAWQCMPRLISGSGTYTDVWTTTVAAPWRQWVTKKSYRRCYLYEPGSGP